MGKKAALVLIMLVAMVAFSVGAQEKSAVETEVNYFVEWDTDTNGTLSEEEFTLGYTADMAEAGEEALGSGEAVVELFGKFDTDANKEISAEEWEAGADLL